MVENLSTLTTLRRLWPGLEDGKTTGRSFPLLSWSFFIDLFLERGTGLSARWGGQTLVELKKGFRSSIPGREGSQAGGLAFKRLVGRDLLPSILKLFTLNQLI